MKINSVQANTYQQNFTATKLSMSKLKMLLDEGKSAAEISEMTGININTLYDILRKLDLKSPRQRKTAHAESVMQQLMSENSLPANIAEIQKATGFSKSWIAGWFHRTKTKTPTQKKQELVTDVIKTSTMTDAEISKATGMSIGNIRELRKRKGLNAHEIKEKLINEQIIAAKKQGLNNVQIAKLLNISKATVKRHLAKMRAQNLDIEI